MSRGSCGMPTSVRDLITYSSAPLVWCGTRLRMLLSNALCRAIANHWSPVLPCNLHLCVPLQATPSSTWMPHSHSHQPLLLPHPFFSFLCRRCLL